MDSGALKTEKSLYKVDKNIRRIYRQVDRQLMSDVELWLQEIYLEDEESTQQQRLDHAEKHGLNNIIETVIIYLLSAGEKSINAVNNNSGSIAKVNHDFMWSSIKKQSGRRLATPGYKNYTGRAFGKAAQSQYVSDKITAELQKGIRKGESIPKLAKRIQNVSTRTRNNALLVARTEATRIKNLTRLEAMYEARDIYGIDLMKQWISTYDTRTRRYPRDAADHFVLNHEERELEDAFSNGLQYPGDLSGPGEEVCNCRCTLAAVLRS